MGVEDLGYSSKRLYYRQNRKSVELVNYKQKKINLEVKLEIKKEKIKEKCA